MTTYHDIARDLAQYQDAQRAAGHQRFFKTGAGEYGEGDKFIGIRMPQIRQVAKKYVQVPLEEVLTPLITSPICMVP